LGGHKGRPYIKCTAYRLRHSGKTQPLEFALMSQRRRRPRRANTVTVTFQQRQVRGLAGVDGGEKTGIAVWRSFTATWHILQPSNRKMLPTHWGLFADVQVNKSTGQ
jgi:hypothetical protein